MCQHYWLNHIKNNPKYIDITEKPTDDRCRNIISAIKRDKDDRIFRRSPKYSKGYLEQKISREIKEQRDKEQHDQERYEREQIERRKQELIKQEWNNTAPLYRKHPDGTTDGMRYDYLLQRGMMPR